jgi:hypothetical protein
MLRSSFIIMALVLNAGCNDQAQSEGKKSGKGDNALSNKVDQEVDKDEEKDGSKKKDDPSPNNKNDTDDESTGTNTTGGCNFKFSDKLTDKVNASGSAQAPLIGNVQFKLGADATLTIKSSTESASVGLNAKINSFTPSIARSIAEKVVNSYKDPLKLTVVPTSELEEFYKNNAGWEKLNCIVAPVTKISNSAYEYEFEPALPVIIAATNSKADIAAAITEAIEIRNIKSKLIRHFQPASVAKRGTYEGSAKIEKSGDEVSISYDFGTKAPEAMATPIAGISFGLSSTKGKYDSVTITTFVADDSKIDLKLSK